MVASISQPVKKLIGFKKVFIPKGDSLKVSFTIKPSDLEIYNANMKKVIEPGEFKVFIGTNSKECQEASFMVERG